MSEIDESEALSYVYSLRNSIVFIFVGVAGVVAIVSFFFSKTLTRPLKELTKFSHELSHYDFSNNSNFEFSSDINAIVNRSDEVGELGKAFLHMKTDLQSSIDNLKKTTSAKERMEGELNIGRDIQMSMLPLIFPAFPDRSEFSIYASLKSAREVGGDFYDYFFIDDDSFCICIGDVSGKGVPSALFMAVTKTLIKSRAVNDYSPASILTQVNDEISQDNKSCMFVTIFLGIININTGVLVYTNAGHNPPYVKCSNDSLVRLDNRHGPVIGAVTGVVYKEDIIKLEKKDILFTYTDGVTEAMDPVDNLFTEERLVALLSSRKIESVEDIINTTLTAIKHFEQGAEQTDDITIMALEFLGKVEGKPVRSFGMIIKNDLLEIERLNQGFNCFADESRIPEKVIKKMNIMFDELLNNIISYAFRDKNEHDIEINVDFYGDRLSITIMDDGIPFNPFDSAKPDTELSLEEREIGGLGIHLVRNIIDKISYKRRIDKNVVNLIKHI
jgi:sigma-B regulation protein RsbU (phosphoserine phosphatase)